MQPTTGVTSNHFTHIPEDGAVVADVSIAGGRRLLPSAETQPWPTAQVMTEQVDSALRTGSQQARVAMECQ